jgi:hypothetical protein
VTRSQVIEKLRAEGYAASVGRLRQALENGYLQPLPEKNARGAYHFTPRHLAQLRWYFVIIRPGPRPELEEEQAITGSTDRMHRLARRKELRSRAPKGVILRRGKQRTDAGKTLWQWIDEELAPLCK